MKNGRYSEEEIARVCHEANKAMQYVQGDPCPSQPWDAEPEWVKEGTINMVRLVRLGYTAKDMHNEWRERYHKDGWVRGDIKDYVAKTHPCLVEYYELPRIQRDKSEVIRGIIVNLSSVF